MEKNLKIIAAFAIGATAGSVLGMLLTPDKQKEPAGETKPGKKRADVAPGAWQQATTNTLERKPMK